jgi:ABC-type branched-subunit amino acid transport system ATPase component
MSAPLLEVKDLAIHFGGLRAVDGVSFALEQGEILGLLGPNGAGKTVTFNLISGVYKPSSGEIRFLGRRIDGLPPHAVAALGLGRTFQIVKPFTTLSVLENVLVARGIDRYGHASSLWTSWRSRRERGEAMALLERVGLADLAGRKAGLLPLGNLRRLEIARALAVGHKLLLLDESFSGLRHEEISRLETLVRDIRAQGLTVLLIEHNMRVAMGLSDRIVVMEYGKKLAEGTPEAIQRDERVIEAYLGRKGEADAS